MVDSDLYWDVKEAVVAKEMRLWRGTCGEFPLENERESWKDYELMTKK